jgi:hypothetical protein
MSLKEERMQILTMLQEGKITADEAATLLSALEGGSQKPEQGPPASKARWLRVRVTHIETGKQKVSVNLPIGLVNVAMKMGAKFAPEIDQQDMGEIMTAIREGTTGKIVEVEDSTDGERVEIFIE